MTIELLAPAGSYEALKAALHNGANAVYLGGQAFSARAYASNFDRETLREAVEYCHIRGMKIYVTLNTLIKDYEINELLEYVTYLYNIDVDALIIQDIGVLSIISKAFPDFQLHSSTQMTLHNSYGIELVKALGVKRVVLARELNLDEIKAIHKKTGMELEVFVHGALCVSYSGQCLISSFIGGRSGNRGRCGQPCRKAYHLIAKGKEYERKYHLSMRDLNTLQHIHKLIDCGVTSFKIEGRMKKPEYVASIVKNYRRGIDYYQEAREIFTDEGAMEEMTQMFNRKFTKGFIFKSTNGDIINKEKPGNIGGYLGQVKEAKKNRITLLLSKSLSTGDGVEIHTKGKEEVGGIITTIYKNNKRIDKANGGDVVEVDLKGEVKAGDKVYKTMDINLLKALRKTYDHENKKIQLKGEITLTLNQPIKLFIYDEGGNTVYRESSNIVEKAHNQPLTEERIRENLNKLGNTPYAFVEINIQLQEGVTIPIAAINSIRREALEEISKLRKNINKRPPITQDVSVEKPIGSSNKSFKGVSIRIDDINLLKGIKDKSKITRLYYGDINTLEEAASYCLQHDIELYYRTSNILKDDELEIFQQKSSNVKIKGILAGDLGGINKTIKHLHLPVVADYTTNPFNSYTLSTYKEWGVNGVVLSPELDMKALKQLNYPPGLDIELLVYGRITAMTIEYCPLDKENQCNGKCQHCSIKPYKYLWQLKDERNISFPMGKDGWGRTLILNSQPLYMLDKLEEIHKLSPSMLQLVITTETVDEVNELLKQLAIKENKGAPIIKEFTRGHYYRGVE